MFQYILTGLAGIAIGIVAMRIWQMRSVSPPQTVEAELASDAGDTSTSAEKAKPNSQNILWGAGALALLAAGVFAFKPSEDENSSASSVSAPSATAMPGGDKALADVDTMVQKLADRLAKNPNDGEGFRMLGWSYVMTGHPEKAITAYQRALVLLPKQANVQAGYGEALVGVAKGQVTPEAKGAFDRAIKIDPTEPRARFFQAQWLAQNGQEKAALDQWIALAGSATADAPWQEDLRRQISETAAKLKVDVSARMPAGAAAAAQSAQLGAPPALDSGTVQAAGALPPADRQAMVDQMVEGLAGKLKTNPKDADGWVRLLRSRMVLKQTEQASRDLGIARQALAGSADKLALINSAAKEFGVPDK